MKLKHDTEQPVDIGQPPSGGCVLKPDDGFSDGLNDGPAAFRRLCVETQIDGSGGVIPHASRLQAAVC